jgi:hypothetical protein
MGPEISEIEGRLLEKDSAQYVLSVQQVRLIRGGEQVWSGERMSVPSPFVTGVAERTFSKGRTIALSSATVGLLVIVFRQSLFGSLIRDEGVTPPDTGIAIRYPRFGPP